MRLFEGLNSQFVLVKPLFSREKKRFFHFGISPYVHGLALGFGWMPPIFLAGSVGTWLDQWINSPCSLIPLHLHWVRSLHLHWLNPTQLVLISLNHPCHSLNSHFHWLNPPFSTASSSKIPMLSMVSPGRAGCATSPGARDRRTSGAADCPEDCNLRGGGVQVNH